MQPGSEEDRLVEEWNKIGMPQLYRVPKPGATPDSSEESPEDLDMQSLTSWEFWFTALAVIVVVLAILWARYR